MFPVVPFLWPSEFLIFLFSLHTCTASTGRVDSVIPKIAYSVRAQSLGRGGRKYGFKLTQAEEGIESKFLTFHVNH